MDVRDASRIPTIDMHTHFFPTGLVDLAATTGDERWPSLHIDETGTGRIMRGSSSFRNVSRSCWDLAVRLEEMDKTGIDHHVLSPVPVTLTTWADSGPAALFARRQNEAFATAVAESTAPERFSWIGCVPLQNTNNAVSELTYSVNELGMRGVEIGTEVDGRELDDPSLLAFYEAAQDLDVPIFVHPTDGHGAIRRQGVPYEFGLGMLTDTSLAATALVFGGVLASYPRLRIGLAHGCGTFAWAYPRLTRGASMGGASLGGASMGAPGGGTSRNEIDELVRRLWVDNLVFDPAHLPLLIERFGADHVMLGSDFPFYPPSFGDPVEFIHSSVACGHCTETQGAAMLGTNADAFFGSVNSPQRSDLRSALRLEHQRHE
jgi:aminocarboxymuconate-semialdehyde decarboxylase